MCLLAGELPAGPGDTLLGEVAGAPVYIDAEQDRRWGHPALVIDVLPGAATSLSLEGADDLHFVTRSPCPRPRSDDPHSPHAESAGGNGFATRRVRI